MLNLFKNLFTSNKPKIWYIIRNHQSRLKSVTELIITSNLTSAKMISLFSPCFAKWSTTNLNLLLQNKKLCKTLPHLEMMLSGRQVFWKKAFSHLPTLNTFTIIYRMRCQKKSYTLQLSMSNWHFIMLDIIDLHNTT